MYGKRYGNDSVSFREQPRTWHTKADTRGTRHDCSGTNCFFVNIAEVLSNRVCIDQSGRIYKIVKAR